MIRLSAFADEISADPADQLAVLQQYEIHYVELRSAWRTPILDLADHQVTVLRGLFENASMRVAAIASPIGKSPVDCPFDVESQALRRAIWLCDVFDCSAIRIFSYYPAASTPGSDSSEWGDKAIERVRALVEQAAEAGVTLLHENDVGLYGQTVAKSIEILDRVPDQHLKAALDPANFLLADERPYPDGYEALRAKVACVHVKDATDGVVVPAGQGDARFPELLQRMKRDGFDGVFALEPHLQSADRFGGFSGPELFRCASDSFKELLTDCCWKWS
jgi:3-dehydroshikimate dehydratase